MGIADFMKGTRDLPQPRECHTNPTHLASIWPRTRECRHELQEGGNIDGPGSWGCGIVDQAHSSSSSPTGLPLIKTNYGGQDVRGGCVF